MAEDTIVTKSGRDLERDAYSPVWEHKKPDTSHRADEHYDAAGKWVCHQCREPIRLVATHMKLTKKLQAAVG